MAFPFEKAAQRALRAVRALRQTITALYPMGYVDADGVNRAASGDEDALYTHAIGRASSSGTSDVQVSAGEAQRLLVDLDGKLWVNTTPASTSIQMVEGDIAHDAADTADSNPVKIGARATATPAAPFAAVAANDRTNLAATLTGGLIVVPEGDVANDSADSGNPIKVGAVAVASPLGLTTAVTAGDRVNLAADLNGHLQVALAGGNRWTKFNTVLATPATSFQVSTANGLIVGRISITLDEIDDVWALVYDGDDANGTLVDRFLVASAAGGVQGTAVRDYTTEGGLHMTTGCFVQLTQDPGAVSAPATGGFCHAIYQTT